MSAADAIQRPLRALQRIFVQLLGTERQFLIFLMVAFAVAGLTYQTPHVARWVGFLFASYATVANDSIQTIGTFIASNKNQRWWHLWLFIGGIFLATMAWSWFMFDGDVSYERLASKGFEETPQSFEFLQVAAPLFLIILTRLKMPVSTTFLLLSCFAASGKSIGAVTLKSISGYGIAFGVAIVVFWATAPMLTRMLKGQAHPAWRVAQWVTSGILWSVWLQQDAANIAVYLPRSLDTVEFLCFAGVIFAGLGVLFKMGGERIQEVVDEKSHVVDVRAATMIDLIYAVILYIFKIQSKVPMSTTWVFVGLLAGREIALRSRMASATGGVRGAVRMMLKDLMNVAIGFVISLILAAAINPVIRKSLFGF